MLSLVSFSVQAGSDASDDGSAAALDGWSVKAKRPKVVGENLIQGSYVYKSENGAAATRGGGACLVADLNDNYPCETRADCLQGQLDGEVKPTPAGGYIYCDSVNNREEKRCWTRPSGGGCARNPANTPGTYQTPAVSSLVDGEQVVWITLACLAAESTPTGCGSEDPTLHTYDPSPRLDLREDKGEDCD